MIIRQITVITYAYLPEEGPPQVGAAQQAGEGSFL